MLVGLQGAGKTTTAGKLAVYLRKQGKRPMLVAADVYRPAAITQLQVVGKQIDIPVFADETPGANPVDIVRRAVEQKHAYAEKMFVYHRYRRTFGYRRSPHG